jgi:hypothetical protein
MVRILGTIICFFVVAYFAIIVHWWHSEDSHIITISGKKYTEHFVSYNTVYYTTWWLWEPGLWAMKKSICL